jgi:hypothetical protein
VRSEGWRYIRYANGDEELYDTSADPLEYTNLAAAEELGGRKAALAKWLPNKDAPNLPSAARGAKAKNRAGRASAGAR